MSNLPTLKQGKPSNAIRQQGRDLLAQKGILDHLSRIAMGEVGEVVWTKALIPAETCVLRVTDPDGGPLEGISVRLLDPEGTLVFEADTDEGGFADVERGGGHRIYCETAVKDQVKAIDTLLKYSIGANRDLTEADVRMRVSKTVEKIAEILPEDEARRVLSAIEPFWTG